MGHGPTRSHGPSHESTSFDKFHLNPPSVGSDILLSCFPILSVSPSPIDSPSNIFHAAPKHLQPPIAPRLRLVEPSTLNIYFYHSYYSTNPSLPCPCSLLWTTPLPLPPPLYIRTPLAFFSAHFTLSSCRACRFDILLNKRLFSRVLQ